MKHANSGKKVATYFVLAAWLLLAACPLLTAGGMGTAPAPSETGSSDAREEPGSSSGGAYPGETAEVDSFRKGSVTTIELAEMRTAKPRDFFLLLISFIMPFISFYLLNDAIAFMKFSFRSYKEAPDPNHGQGMAGVFCIIIPLIWIGYTTLRISGQGDLPIDGVIRLLLTRPVLFAPGLILASLVPLGIAVHKSWTTITFLRSSATKAAQAYGRSVVSIFLEILAVVANVWTLIEAFKKIGEVAWR